MPSPNPLRSPILTRLRQSIKVKQNTDFEYGHKCRRQKVAQAEDDGRDAKGDSIILTRGTQTQTASQPDTQQGPPTTGISPAPESQPLIVTPEDKQHIAIPEPREPRDIDDSIILSYTCPHSTTTQNTNNPEKHRPRQHGDVTMTSTEGGQPPSTIPNTTSKSLGPDEQTAVSTPRVVDGSLFLTCGSPYLTSPQSPDAQRTAATEVIVDHPTSKELLDTPQNSPRNTIKDSLLFNNASNLLLEALGDIDRSMYTSTPFVPSYTPENERISLLVSPFVMEDTKSTQSETQDIERSPLLFESVSEDGQKTLQQGQSKHTEHCHREECRNALEEVKKQKRMVTRLQNEIRRLTSVKQASEELVSSLKRKLRVTQELDVSMSDLTRDADRQTKDEDCMLGESEEEDNPCDHSKTNNNHSGNKESERVEETGSKENRD